jgi:hypothetical protein
MKFGSDILLYQMGKVGSSSVNQALHKAGVTAIHAHWINDNFYMPEFPTAKPPIVKAIRSGDAPAFKVITLVREPVRRSISAYFQQPRTYSGLEFRKKSPEAMMQDLLDFYRVDYPDLWFDLELLDLFEFDIYGEPFNYKKGYQTYQKGKHKLLLIRLEDAKRCLPKAIKEFLGVSGCRMLERNVFKERHNQTILGNAYRAVENLKHAQHFYSDEERAKLKEKWLG